MPSRLLFPSRPHATRCPVRRAAAVLGALALLPVTLPAHTIGDPAHDGPDRVPPSAQTSAAAATVAATAGKAVPAGESGDSAASSAAGSTTPPAVVAAQTDTAFRAFARFAPAVRVRADGPWLLIESNGLPAHGMMVGITAWQQQVPLPQPYTGANAWRLPLHPAPAAAPVSVRDRFLRGAIALAANGIPIFNPQNNRGEVSFDIGELDRWGGHCGRSDDYHYHIAPLHLQETLGPTLPIAYALDGYAIYGLTEPSGATPQGLDRFHGHETPDLGYHYHASIAYPFVNGGFHGVVTEREGQVDPQPRARGVRPALTALRGAEIVGFTGSPGRTTAEVSYVLRGRTGSVAYTSTSDGQWMFRFTEPDGATREVTYRAGDRSPRGPRDPREARPEGRERKPEARRSAPASPAPATTDSSAPAPAGASLTGRSPSPPATPTEVGARPAGGMVLTSPAVGPEGALPREYTGDGDGHSPPLAWSGAPEGTRSFAVIMHHLAPDGAVKCYWTLYNLAAKTRGVPADVRGQGELGHNTVNHRVGYAPPHSKGPGLKTYVITLYALSAPLTLVPDDTDRPALLAAMRDRILDHAELRVTYTRSPESLGGEGAPRRGGDS